jgi:hypothetical protein
LTSLLAIAVHQSQNAESSNGKCERNLRERHACQAAYAVG